MSAVTVSEAFRRLEPKPIDHIFPGSWINANFDVWIGAEEDNQAWTQLLRARETFDLTTGVPEERRGLALEEILIAEGSDWNWWYGPEHSSENREEFDQLYRSHLANVYRFLNLMPPEELSPPILRMPAPEVQIKPSGAIRPVIDGEVTSFFEWVGAGVYRIDERSGAMHGKRFLVKEVRFGSDGVNLYVRVDFHPGNEHDLTTMEAQFTLQSISGGTSCHAAIAFANGAVRATGMETVECALGRVLEVKFPLVALELAKGSGVRFQFSIWQNGLPIDAVPQQGWLEMASTERE